MHTKHDRTLAGVFTDPVPANIKWRDIEALFVALGAELVEGRGSRVTVFLGAPKRPSTVPTRARTLTKGPFAPYAGF